jgi:cell division septation protein DedD
MSREWLFGILGAIVLAALGTVVTVLVFAGEKWVQDIAVASQPPPVVKRDEFDALKGDVSSIRGTLENQLAVQQALLDAVLNSNGDH